MNEILVAILLSFSHLIGVDAIPHDPQWKILSAWSESNGISSLSAKIENLESFCAPGKTITFPMIIHGAHQVSVDGKIITTFGDPTFKKATPFYLKPSIQCDAISGKELKWTVFSYSQYFARFKYFPSITNDNPAAIILFHEIFNIIAGTGLLLLCFITSIIFYRKIQNDVLIANIFANLGFSMYFIFSCSNYFLANISMLNAHKLADLGVWLGIVAFFYTVFRLNLCSKTSFKTISIISGIAYIIIAFANDGDTIQFGTTLPFPILILVLIEATIKSFINLKKIFIGNVTRTLSVLFFFLAGVYEIVIVVGLVDSSPILSIGILGALIAMTLIVQAGITNTYQQRDELLAKLEIKVEERTSELSRALKDKENAQAELIQSAKLASLGTLSAGIAHEINNNINYVNACVIGLEKEFAKVDIPNKAKIEKLVSTIKHGTKMTIDIVNSLRNFTGLNQAKTKNIEFKEIVTSVKSIIKRKLELINFQEDYDADTLINCNVVGINQMIMNLLTNAIDAVDRETGEIKVTAKRKIDFLEITVSDNGSGIPSEIIDKIFDPFFTTKDVGSGTGLGLHIVKKEVDHHKGTIKIRSTVGQGTTFIIHLPYNLKSEAAA
jgi:signal transduction histidine kinase